MKKHIIRYASFAFAILGMVSCSEEQETALRPQDAKSTPMTFLVSHPGQATRAQKPVLSRTTGLVSTWQTQRRSWK